MNVAGVPVTARELVLNALGGLLVLIGFIAFCALAAGFVPDVSR